MNVSSLCQLSSAKRGVTWSFRLEEVTICDAWFSTFWTRFRWTSLHPPHTGRQYMMWGKTNASTMNFLIAVGSLGANLLYFFNNWVAQSYPHTKKLCATWINKSIQNGERERWYCYASTRILLTLTRAPLGYFYNAPHWWGGGGYFEPPPPSDLRNYWTDSKNSSGI